jgi:hypothetical protein
MPNRFTPRPRPDLSGLAAVAFLVAFKLAFLTAVYLIATA